METLLDRVPTPQGDIIVITKTKFLFFFSRPRTSVMPYRISDFGRRLGFQALYKTSDPETLAEFHAFFIEKLAAEPFEELMLAAKNGIIDLPPEREHLRKHILGFRA